MSGLFFKFEDGAIIANKFSWMQFIGALIAISGVVVMEWQDLSEIIKPTQ